ncbi:MAG TPA: dihydroorotase, partial [Candidatus Limnocylindria bacterium]|nr:dihydroorotase [Candidatus Limnocylindria bacterium]
EPGGDGAETLESGSRAAAHGGFTTVCTMPNTDPPLDRPELVAELLDRATAAACRVRVLAAATRGREGQEASDIRSLASLIVGVSDDGASIPTADVARDVMRALREVDLPLVEHAEDPTIADGSVMRAGLLASRLGLAGWPPEAELSIVERDLALAEATGARLHLTHLSTAGSVDAVRRARERGVAVTCDVTPHHLALTEDWVAGSRRFVWEDPEPNLQAAYDGRCRVNPPLPSRDDALALLAALDDGSVDAIATDHAPHPAQRKLVPFDEAAPGLIGLETALSIGLAAVDAGRLRLSRLLAALSTRPAAVIGERRALSDGAEADLVLFDPAARWRVERDALASASVNTPLLGMDLPGVVRLTVAAGRVTYRS